MKVTSTDKYEQALDIVCNTKANLFLTGKAGTGKTTFLKKLKSITMKRMIVAAPTGIAAINAGGMTIHSLFQFPLVPFFAWAVQQEYSTNLLGKKKKELLENIDLLVIDEVSMVRADLMDAIDYRLRTVRNSSKPFGGVQLLLIGDLFQLAPVVKSKDKQLLGNQYSSLFFFESNALKKSKFFVVELDKVFRQTDEHFKNLLNKLREGKISQSLLSEINQRYIPNFEPTSQQQYVKLVTHISQAEEINKNELEKLPGEEKVYDATINGDFPESMYPALTQIGLKVGAHVMIIKNDLDKDIYNGSLGIITELKDESVSVLLSDSGNTIDIEPFEWSNIDYEVIEPNNTEEESIPYEMPRVEGHQIGTFKQLPIRLSWAITIHKSQGLTFERAIIDAHRSFAPGQTYVALSRCRSLDGLVLSNEISWSAIKCDHKVQEFQKESKKYFPDESTLEEYHKEAYLEYVHNALDLHSLYKYISSLKEYILGKVEKGNEEQLQILSKSLNDFKMSAIDQYDSLLVPIDNIVHLSPNYSKDLQINRLIIDHSNFMLAALSNYEEATKGILFNTGNKGYRKNIDKLVNKIQTELNFKKQILSYIVNSGFNVTAIQQKIRELSGFQHNIKSYNGIVIENKEVGDKNECTTTSRQKTEILERIKALRTTLAERGKVPSYCIFSNAVADAIAEKRPSTLEELLTIPGIGEKKISQFGEELLSIVKWASSNMETNAVHTSKQSEISDKSDIPESSTEEITLPKGIQNPELYTQLKDWCQSKNTSEGGILSSILPNQVCVSLCILLPTTLELLAKVPGMGKKRIEAYGSEIIDIIQDYVRTKGITPPEIGYYTAIKKAMATKDSHLVSLEMFQNGYSTGEIAAERYLSEYSVKGHLVKCAILGLIPLDRVCDLQRIEELRRLIADKTDYPKRDIYELFNGKYDYHEIELAIHLNQQK